RYSSWNRSACLWGFTCQLCNCSWSAMVSQYIRSGTVQVFPYPYSLKIGTAVWSFSRAAEGEVSMPVPHVWRYSKCTFLKSKSPFRNRPVRAIMSEREQTSQSLMNGDRPMNAIADRQRIPGTVVFDGGQARIGYALNKM